MGNFRDMLEARWASGNFVCVGLDSEFDKIPQSVYACHTYTYDVAEIITAFNQRIVEATKDLACAYKPNVAFYEAQGILGITALRNTITAIHTIASGVPVILDAKRADIGNTNKGYVQAVFDYLGADAVTVHPYFGAEALQPFLEQKEKGVFVLCRTSNPGAGEIQNLIVEGERVGGVRQKIPLYQHIAHLASHPKHWNKNGNCALVVGATCPDELAEVRRIAGDTPILIPGIGAQGGDVEKTIKAGRDSRKQGMIINSSRGIIFASNGADFAEAARRETQKLHVLINQYR